MGSIICNPSVVACSQSMVTINLVGIGTNWVSGTTVFSVSSAHGAAKVSQAILSTTAAELQISTGNAADVPSISDGTYSGLLVIEAVSAPDVVGIITARVLSFPTVSGTWQMAWNVGDTQPLISIALSDGNSNPVLLSGATVTAAFISDPDGGSPSVVQTSTLTVDGSGLCATYERQASDYTTLNAGWYGVRISADYGNSLGFSAPSTGYLYLLVNPAA